MPRPAHVVGGRSSKDDNWDRDDSVERERLTVEHYVELKAKTDDQEIRENLDKCARANAEYDRGRGEDVRSRKATAAMQARSASRSDGPLMLG